MAWAGNKRGRTGLRERTPGNEKPTVLETDLGRGLRVTKEEEARIIILAGIRQRSQYVERRGR